MEREFRYLFNTAPAPPPQTSSFQGQLTPQVSSGSSAQRSWSTRTGTPLTSCKRTPLATPRTTSSTRGSASALTPSLAQPGIQGFNLRRPDTPLERASSLFTPRPAQIEEEEKVSAWQNEVDCLEAQQVQIQANQMNLLHSQIHILTRELGDLQKQFVDFDQQINQKVDILRIDVEAAQEQLAQDVAAAHGEAHAALRLELAEHGNSAAEMQAAWEEAHITLSKAMNDGLRGLAEDSDKALKEQSVSHARALEEHASAHGNSLIEMEASHNAKHEEHSANLQQGLEDVQGYLQKDLAELRSGHAVNLQKVVEDVTNQVEILTLDIEQMAKDVAVTQHEAHSALRLELAEHGNNADEMKSAWEEAHNSLSKAMDDSLGNLAEEHARALEEHTAAQAQALLEHADKHGNSLAELEDLHNRRSEEHTACLQKGLEEVHGSLQQELAELRSGHEVNLQKVVEHVTTQVDKLTLDMEQMTRDVATAQEEAHSALRLELAEHGNNADEMKSAWAEAHHALSLAMDDTLSDMAAQHAKALDSHREEHARALAEHADAMGNHGSNLSELEDLHNQRYEEHQAALQSGLEDVHGNLQNELAELRSGHAVNLQKILEDVTTQVDKLTLDMEQMTRDVATAQEEAHSALRLELAEHSGNASDMKAAWEEAHKALADSMDDNLGKLAQQHADAIAEHGETVGSAHGRLQQELKDLRSSHAANLKEILQDVVVQVDALTVSMENASTVRTANTAKLETLLKGMSSAMNVSFRE